MTDYADLDGKIDDIARAAIEWQMHLMGWNGDLEHGWTSIGLTSSSRVSPDGSLETDGHAVDDPYYPNMINGWKTDTRTVLEPWTQLPDPSYLDYNLDALRTQMNSLFDPADVEKGNVDPDPEHSGVPELGNGSLHSARATIDTKIGNMEGETAAQMYEVLVSKMDDVMKGEFAAVGVLGVHLAGQQQTLQKAREDVARLFDACYDVMDNMGAVGGDVDFSIVSALIGAAGVFATGGLATALGAAGAAIGLADALLPEGEEPDKLAQSLGAYRPDDCWDKVTGALNKLNEQITSHEREIYNRGDKAAGVVGGAGFSLAAITGEGSDPGALSSAGDIVRIDQGGLKYVAESSIPTACNSLDRTRVAIDDLDPSYAMTRPASIGYASDGIYGAWSGLQDSTVGAVKGTADELWTLRTSVIAVLNKFGVTDIEQAERYRKMVPTGGACYGY
jgi:hypothetical protein